MQAHAKPGSKELLEVSRMIAVASRRTKERSMRERQLFSKAFQEDESTPQGVASATALSANRSSEEDAAKPKTLGALMKSPPVLIERSLIVPNE